MRWKGAFTRVLTGRRHGCKFTSAGHKFPILSSNLANLRAEDITSASYRHESMYFGNRMSYRPWLALLPAYPPKTPERIRNLKAGKRFIYPASSVIDRGMPDKRRRDCSLMMRLLT